MTAKGKKQPEVDKNVLKVAAKPGEEGKQSAAAMMRPTVQAVSTIRLFGGDKELSLMDYVDAMTEQSEAVHKGDMGRAEEMLITQAHTLNELFNNLARKAHGQQYLAQYESFMRMALKAQAQCTRTLEVLSTIKNPPVIFAKQANVTTGPQQVNNGIPASAAVTHAEKNQNRANELLEVRDGERMDTGTASAASGTDKAMATLDEIDRSAKS